MGAFFKVCAFLFLSSFKTSTSLVYLRAHWCQRRVHQLLHTKAKSPECHRQDWYQCSKLVKIVPCPQDTLLSKVSRPHILYQVQKSLKAEFLLCSTKMTISPLIIVRFENFKIWHTLASKPILQDGLDSIFVCPDIFLSASDGRTGIIRNTVGILTY